MTAPTTWVAHRRDSVPLRPRRHRRSGGRLAPALENDEVAKQPAVDLGSSAALILKIEMGIRIGRSRARGVLGCESRPMMIPMCSLRIRPRAAPGRRSPGRICRSGA